MFQDIINILSKGAMGYDVVRIGNVCPVPNGLVVVYDVQYVHGAKRNEPGEITQRCSFLKRRERATPTSVVSYYTLENTIIV